MTPQFICHPDFAQLVPLDMFHKENDPREIQKNPPELQNRHILFRKKLTVDKVQTAILRISADDRYRLYINGRFVTEGPSPSYPCHYYYNELNITNYLRVGENTFAIHTYYQGTVNRVWVSGDQRQMLWLSLDVGNETVMVSDESFLCRDHSGYTECGTIAKNTAFAQRYDSRAAEDRFYLPDFDDSGWEHASVFSNADYTLERQPTRQLVYESVEPIHIEKTQRGIRADFGRETAGYLYLTAHGRSGDTVILRYGEELNADGSVRYDMRSGCRYEEQWVLSGGDDTLGQFDYRGFRYAELIYPDTVTSGHISMIARHYPYSERAVYSTDSEELRKIIRLCADTVKYGTQEVFIDCPTREKGQYLGDVAIAARAQAILTANTDMIKKSILDFCHTSFICKGIMAVSTASKMQEIADYSLQLPALAVWVYSMDGDLDFLSKVQPYMTGLYRYMLKYETAEGLIDGVLDKWNLVDWPENLRDGYNFDLTRPIKKGVHNVLNAFWCGFLQAMDELYVILGMPPTGRTEKAKKAFIKTFYSERSGLFCDTPELTHSAVHSNILPLLFDIGTEDRELCDRLADFIKQKRLGSMGVYMAYFALAALVKQGYKKIATELATDVDCWLRMLSEGATTTFEAWGKEQKKNCSLFHPWATAPLIVFADGIRIY